MSVSLYPEIIHQNDLSPEHFGSQYDDLAAEIYEATKGWGANKKKVIDALAGQDAAGRYKLAIRYKELYGKELVDVMRKEFSGMLTTSDFGVAMEFLALPLDQAECAMINKASKGVGSQVNIIWSILCGRTNEEIDHLKKTYFKMYTKDLGKLLASELHGDMERIAFNCLQGAEEVFDPQFHTPAVAAEQAEAIYEMGQGKWGTDEKGIFKLICAAPPKHVAAINQAYSDKYGYTLLKGMEKELSGNVRDATLHMIGMKLKPYETMARLIKAACAGFGTDELLLTCCVIRYQGVLGQVQAAHIELFDKSIHARVRSETSGNYRALLLQVLNAVWPED